MLECFRSNRQSGNVGWSLSLDLILQVDRDGIHDNDGGFFILWTAINDGILFLLMEVLVIVEDWFFFVLYVYTDSSAKHDKEMLKILSSIIIIFC